jgi:hypothetical protein
MTVLAAKTNRNKPPHPRQKTNHAPIGYRLVGRACSLTFRRPWVSPCSASRYPRFTTRCRRARRKLSLSQGKARLRLPYFGHDLVASKPQWREFVS